MEGYFLRDDAKGIRKTIITIMEYMKRKTNNGLSFFDENLRKK